MLITPRCARIAAAGAVGAGALTSALLFGGTPIAQAAPPATITSVAQAPQLGPHVIPVRGGHGWGGHGHGGWGHGGTSEVQLNIIAERLLGLPRDP
ncbi:hypothetical protein A5645_02150 [Mycobacterium asiaticum]|nr:hypothetical protein [Mycobacterium asiaticum]OBK91658.1 hypothetical protein A5645_02150 [Mycobacterium asiaticum]